MHLHLTDLLDLGGGHALAVVPRDDGGLSAVPAVRVDGEWRRASVGDGTAEALVHLLTTMPGRSAHGRFTIDSWAAPGQAVGERAINVDQTNESVIVGDHAVAKWATHLAPGPHPAPARLSTLQAAGFTAMPPLWGIVTWQPDGGEQTLAATVTGYLPAAVDGWTWAVDLAVAAARSDDTADITTTWTAVGEVIADLHAALACTETVSTADDARRWRDAAFGALAAARALAGPSNAALLDERREDVERILDVLGELVRIPIIDAHGDLHVGQILRAQERFVVTDFDGNPVLSPAEQGLPVPAALDVAGMLQSLTHVAIVAAVKNDLDPGVLARIDEMSRSAFLDAYTARIAGSGHADLFAGADVVTAFRLQQVLREIIYAGRHLPRWMYVPELALPALLEGVAR
ncbi:glucosamine kinase [Mycobacterium sp. 852013-50091_SCH5140682]|uniref:glucosamine kinase n=1 Tax=Mycobacterium sp. 852013-50091_SCH5140682 TaxID=1834109 RepID=UPI000A705F30|nr:glucosamine kinase [Mycobacterium sp. 852013-50091_SCH5140682]